MKVSSERTPRANEMSKRYTLPLQQPPKSLSREFYFVIEKWNGHTVCHRPNGAANDELGILAFKSEEDAEKAIRSNQVVVDQKYKLLLYGVALLWTKILETGLRLYIYQESGERLLIQESILSDEIYQAVIERCGTVVL